MHSCLRIMLHALLQHVNDAKTKEVILLTIWLNIKVNRLREWLDFEKVTNVINS